ncbi:hypothetical protein GS415_06715 [Rhodococcus hoagii]|nr:hypothetical protein [Prescottella equi]
MTLTRDDVIDVLTAAASVDLRKIGDADVEGWSATLRADLDRDLALEALRVHYATSAERLMPAHINKLAVQIRRDRAEREKAAEIITRPDRQLGGLPINADGDPSGLHTRSTMRSAVSARHASSHRTTRASTWRRTQPARSRARAD